MTPDFDEHFFCKYYNELDEEDAVDEVRDEIEGRSIIEMCDKAHGKHGYNVADQMLNCCREGDYTTFERMLDALVDEIYEIEEREKDEAKMESQLERKK